MEGEDPQDIQNMLVIDPTNDPESAYNPYQDVEGMFGQNMEAPYHARNDDNLIPRDVIPEDENERTQDSAMIKITEEREDTRNSYMDNKSQSQTPNKPQEQEEDDYEDDYEDDEPVETKPFENNQEEATPVNQEEYLKMLQNPVDRPGTRNPRMQREKKSKSGADGSAKKSEGEKQENNTGGFALPDDSDE